MQCLTEFQCFDQVTHKISLVVNTSFIDHRFEIRTLFLHVQC